jgi:hypothetical protein
MVAFYDTPIIKTEKDPQMESGKYETFALKPASEVAPELEMDPIIEKYLLCAIRNELEFLGYECVGTQEKPDFCIGFLYFNDYKSTYIPASTVTEPWYVPGDNQTTNLNLYGSSGYLQGTIKTTSPGHYVPVTVTRPKRYVGAYYPILSVNVFSSDNWNVIWAGTVIASTSEADVRRTANTLLPSLFDLHFPIARQAAEKRDPKRGIFGCPFRVFTINGDDYFPIISAIMV